MDIVGAEATDLFVGSEADPRQVVRVVLRATVAGVGRGIGETGRLAIGGDWVRAWEPIVVGPLGAGEEVRLEVGVAVEPDVAPGHRLRAEAVVETDAGVSHRPFELVVAEPGWRMFMVAHFHYDPVWWNTQAAYTETWGEAIAYRQPFQEPGLALVRAHLETARRDPLYKFVLAELDYLKPYWDTYPEDREYVRQLLREGRLELVGATYNEPNTNLTSAESTIRNAIYGIAYQRDVLGGDPVTAWQLDVFGHDPQFPGIMADAGATSSSWARGPFHEWGPHWVRGPARLPFAALAAPPTPEMQFPTEFDWVAPSGRALLTSFMANHYSAGWWMDAATTLEEAEAQVHALFRDLVPLATTRNVLLPVGTDYSPPNRWLTAIVRDWNARYVWPRFLAATPREFFEAVRAERAAAGRPFPPQTRDMNPIYAGKDVSFIDTKQAQRVAENTLLGAEKLAAIGTLLGAPFPHEAIDKAWRQLLFGAHHDGITGSESDQVYLDLLGGWREALELGRSALDGAVGSLAGAIDTRGEGQAILVVNPLAWARTDVARLELRLPEDATDRGLELRDDLDRSVPFAVETVERRPDGALARVVVSFVAVEVPALGYRTYRAIPADVDLELLAWRRGDGTSAVSERFEVTVDPGRGGTIGRIVDRRTGRNLLRPGGLGNELLAYEEYPNHPLFGEGPWHLTPDGRVRSAADESATVAALESPVGRRVVVEGPFADCRRRHEVTLWDGVERIELTTRLDGYDGHDRLFRVRFAGAVEGGRSVSEVGNAVVGRPFGRPNVDVGEVPFTLDNPAYNWFGLGSTARIVVRGSTADRGDDDADADREAALAISVAEVVAADTAALDDALRELVVGLVRAGVTATLTRPDGPRYGVLHIDSNLPDVRISIGGPAENAFTTAVLEAADASGAGYRAELERQLAARGRGRVLVPAVPRSGGPADPIPDLRGVRDLPVLVVAGRDENATQAAMDELRADLGDATIGVEQPAALSEGIGHVEDATLAVLNRGLPGFSVTADGDLYLSLLRSSSGWPSGVWINPPRRSTPDGANFEFEHWTHEFEYALAAGEGDWRAAEIVRIGHEYNNPLVVVAVASDAGPLPAAASLVEVDPPSVVLTALKPAGNPLARMAVPDAGGTGQLVLRAYESAGRRTRATIRARWPIHSAERTNVLEAGGEPVPIEGAAILLDLEPYEIATVRASVEVGAAEIATPGTDGASPVAAEPAEPVFVDYWMHNKGPAPIGYQPVIVGIRPWLLAGSGPFRVPVVVASERTDEPVEGTVRLLVPDGWRATPPERPYRLAPGAYVAFEATVEPDARAQPGRYFVAARIADPAGRLQEDVVTIDLGPDAHGAVAAAATADPERSASLAAAIGRAVRGGEPLDRAAPAPPQGVAGSVGGELEAEMLGLDGVCLAPGERGRIRVALRNLARSEIRGEAQLLGPLETWSFTRPWSRGFSVPPAGTSSVEFDVAPPVGTRPGSWWALVKVMAFGRLLYTESVPLEVVDAAAD
ncbi:MAG TPA: glycoside hydrolase family 38 C-terminal domain-containing protein [Candidatus Limnocylindrales bacterium]|nr:glycoside hydrolase family 38 C-terminal domain-containing protein [Candidatus Limnocylindrales bacterium]